MNLLCIGINHRTAHIEIRERVWFSNDEIRRALPELKTDYFRECVLVSTCNRTELYAIPKDDKADTESVKKLLTRFKGSDQKVPPEQFYTLKSLLAVRHVFRVASGIDSMVLGDVQILGQMKESFELAQQAKTVGMVLGKLFHAAFRSGKRARTETEISEGAVSVSSAAVELAGKIFDDLSRRKALLIGAGDTGKLTAKHLLGKNIGKLLLTNRTHERAEEIASQLGGTVVAYIEMPRAAEEVDIVITSVNAPSYILSSADLHTIMKHRAKNPLVIIDIGVPRNVDPAANEIDNVFLHDVDALKLVVESNLDKRRTEIPKVQDIVHEELLEFYRWFNTLQVTPTIQELRDQLEFIRQMEVQKAITRFSAEQLESVELLTKRIVNKILHTPLMNLKNGTNGEGSEDIVQKISTIRGLFGLDAKKHGRKTHTEEE